MTSDQAFSRKQLQELLEAFADRLAERGQRVHMFVVGGAAMSLVYDDRRTTRDIDAVWSGDSSVREIIDDLAEEQDLPHDWLNDGVKGFMPGDDDHAVQIFTSDSLVVHVASPEYLLAMKLTSARGGRDFDDAVTLFNKAKLTTAEEALNLLEKWYPPRLLRPEHAYTAHNVAATALEQRMAWSQDEVPPAVNETDCGPNVN